MIIRCAEKGRTAITCLKQIKDTLVSQVYSFTSLQIYSSDHAYFSESLILFNRASSDFKNEKNSLQHISSKLY